MKPFFQEINDILSDKDSVNITISKQSDNLIVSIIPKTSAQDDAVKKIVPLVVSGTAIELDEEYINIISESISTSLKIVSNIKEFEDSNIKAKENSKASKEKKEQAKKEEEENKKKVDALIKKADAFELKPDTNKLFTPSTFPYKFEKWFNELIKILEKWENS